MSALRGFPLPKSDNKYSNLPFTEHNKMLSSLRKQNVYRVRCNTHSKYLTEDGIVDTIKGQIIRLVKDTDRQPPEFIYDQLRAGFIELVDNHETADNEAIRAEFYATLEKSPKPRTPDVIHAEMISTIASKMAQELILALEPLLKGRR